MTNGRVIVVRRIEGHIIGLQTGSRPLGNRHVDGVEHKLMCDVGDAIGVKDVIEPAGSKDFVISCATCNRPGPQRCATGGASTRTGTVPIGRRIDAVGRLIHNVSGDERVERIEAMPPTMFKSPTTAMGVLAGSSMRAARSASIAHPVHERVGRPLSLGIFPARSVIHRSSGSDYS